MSGAQTRAKATNVTTLVHESAVALTSILESFRIHDKAFAVLTAQRLQSLSYGLFNAAKKMGEVDK